MKEKVPGAGAAAAPVRGRSTPFFSRSSGAAFFPGKTPAGGPAPFVQAVFLDGPNGLHTRLLDQFSEETGYPRDLANVHLPEYETWAIVRGLHRETLDRVLLELERYDSLGQLFDLIRTGRQLAGNYPRETIAMKVVYESRSGNSAGAVALAAGASLPLAEKEALRLFAQTSSRREADQRGVPGSSAEARLPDADTAREIGYELEPSSRPAPAAPAATPAAPGAPPPPPPPRIPWDGRDNAPDFLKKRAQMQAELFQAFDAYLTFKRSSVVARLKLPRVLFSTPKGALPGTTSVVDIAGQAREVLETRYGVSLDAGAPSAGLTQARGPVQTATNSLGPRLFDSSSETDRQDLTGDSDLSVGIAWWLFENDRPGAAGAAGSRPFATEILAAHNYSIEDAGARQFRRDVAQVYAAASTLKPNNARHLIDYRLTVSEADPTGAGRGFTVQSSFDPRGGSASQAELRQRWQIFGTAVHESLHLRTHPGFVKARQGRGTLIEGFTEMFTIATLNTDVLPRVRGGRAEALRLKVEGRQSPAAPDPAIVADRVTPPQYVEHRAQAERIRDGGTAPGGVAHQGVGEAAVRAAYFQGHVEYLGLDSDGSQLPGLPAAGAPPVVHVPAGINGGLAELSLRSGVPVYQIRQDNPGITDSLPAAAVLAGCRDHRVVDGETRAKIAIQNGVSEADLVRANPDLPRDPATGEWPALTAGRKILIPSH